MLKHSQQTPLCGERILLAFQQAGLPQNVLQVLHMDHELTANVIEHPLTSFVNFTGSVPGGRAIYQSVAKKFIGKPSLCFLSSNTLFYLFIIFPV